jgi:hypothetical protein
MTARAGRLLLVKAPAHERLGDIYPALAATHFDVSGLRHAQRPNARLSCRGRLQER